MPIAGRITATKVDPRLLICIGFLGTAFTLQRLTVVNLQIDFHTIVVLRMTQVLFMPFIFIPISTLNYVGVPREKNNQVSDFPISRGIWEAVSEPRCSALSSRARIRFIR